MSDYYNITCNAPPGLRVTPLEEELGADYIMHGLTPDGKKPSIEVLCVYTRLGVVNSLLYLINQIL